MTHDFFEFVGPTILKLLAGAACVIIFAPLLAAIVAPLIG